MTPDDRRGWLAFAFILWIGLGVAFDKPALLVMATALLLADFISGIWRGLKRNIDRRGELDPLDNGGVVLDP